MPTPWKTQRSAFNPNAQTLVTTAETVIATISGVNTSGPQATVDLLANFALFAGTGTTNLTVRIRRGVDTTGAVVGAAATEAIAASAGASVSFQVTDTPGEVANQSYVLTVAQVGATGNASTVTTSLVAVVG